MEWKGIPYSLDAKDIMESVNSITTVAVDKIPTVIVSTSFSWETVVAAFLSALIPSLIAWYALKNNYKLAEYQNTLATKEKWVSDFRVALAEFISETSIFTSKISMNPSLISSTDEKAVEFSKYNLLLLLINASDAEIKFTQLVIQISNKISDLKTGNGPVPGIGWGLEVLHDKIQEDLKVLMIAAKPLMDAKWIDFL
nr:hypothetical protein [Providencia sp. PROV188]